MADSDDCFKCSDDHVEFAGSPSDRSSSLPSLHVNKGQLEKGTLTT